uniref:Secreted protein n=1 Tax=Alexandrium catenella TaxID=2925 RepID=A0A7S1Q0D9_ALECA|mmetsp:Transcript_118274/g.314742  ORF Transcript_118274/g.314742 Transcript_118274/m.314742 type:complete len:264 (+) Transcript_118274:120-911(+)
MLALALAAGLAVLGHGARLEARARAAGSHAGELKTRTGLAGNPLVARYRELARHYRDDALDAEAAAMQWAARARAAVYGGGERTQKTTYKEVERQGVSSLARSVHRMDRMLRDPRPKRAAEAAQRAAAPYEEALEEYRETSASYSATADGYARRADNDAAWARQLAAYADQHRLQGGDAAAAPFAEQSLRLTKEAMEYRGVAADYSTKAERVREALPAIERMAKEAGAYAAWADNPAGAVAQHQLYTYTVAPPIGDAESDGER